MLDIIRTDDSKIEFNVDYFQNKINRALSKLDIEECEITMTLVSNNKIRELNSAYLGINEITDVLSFSGNEMNPETGNLYLGDIVISIEKAKSQAEYRKHSLESELVFLAIHGLLHLLEYNHSHIFNKMRMYKKQEEIIKFIDNK